MKHPLWSRIILAIDLSDYSQILRTAERFRPYLQWIKVGMVPFLVGGHRLLHHLKKDGWKIFLDLKFHDIPNTVYGSVLQAINLGVDMVNVHALGGPEMLKAAHEARIKVNPEIKLIAVTLLTSHQSIPWAPNESMEPLIRKLVEWTLDSGLDGVVCSPHEVEMIKKSVNEEFITVTPGIRFKPPDDDQRRWMTPDDAFKAGADYIVMGRSLINLSLQELERLDDHFHQTFPLDPDKKS